MARDENIVRELFTGLHQMLCQYGEIAIYGIAAEEMRELRPPKHILPIEDEVLKRPVCWLSAS